MQRLQFCILWIGTAQEWKCEIQEDTYFTEKIKELSRHISQWCKEREKENAPQILPKLVMKGGKSTNCSNLSFLICKNECNNSNLTADQI